MEFRHAIGNRLAAFLSKPLPGYRRVDTVTVDAIAEILLPGDVVLVEGDTRISVAVKYLTQSSWSHACLFVGDSGSSSLELCLLEADLQGGGQANSAAALFGFQSADMPTGQPY